MIIETLKYINYYSIIQYWDDIVNLNSDLKFKILHSLRNSYRGRIPQQLHIHIYNPNYLNSKQQSLTTITITTFTPNLSTRFHNSIWKL